MYYPENNPLEENNFEPLGQLSNSSDHHGNQGQDDKDARDEIKK